MDHPYPELGEYERTSLRNQQHMIHLLEATARFHGVEVLQEAIDATAAWEDLQKPREDPL